MTISRRVFGWFVVLIFIDDSMCKNFVVEKLSRPFKIVFLNEVFAELRHVLILDCLVVFCVSFYDLSLVKISPNLILTITVTNSGVCLRSFIIC